MFKRGRRYWYVLGDGYLAYYKAQETPQLLGVIDLRDVILVEEVGSKTDKKPKKETAVPASFNLITSTRAYQLQAESLDLRKEWVSLVRAQIEGPHFSLVFKSIPLYLKMKCQFSNDFLRPFEIKFSTL